MLCVKWPFRRRLYYGSYNDFDFLFGLSISVNPVPPSFCAKSQNPESQHLSRAKRLVFIGGFSVPKEEIDPAVLAAQEEEERKTLERRERLHQAYLKRKANGKQAEYEQRYNERRRANYAAKKAALFDEEAVLGAGAAAAP